LLLITMKYTLSQATNNPPVIIKKELNKVVKRNDNLTQLFCSDEACLLIMRIQYHKSN